MFLATRSAAAAAPLRSGRSGLTETSCEQLLKLHRSFRGVCYEKHNRTHEIPAMFLPRHVAPPLPADDKIETEIKNCQRMGASIRRRSGNGIETESDGQTVEV